MGRQKGSKDKKPRKPKTPEHKAKISASKKGTRGWPKGVPKPPGHMEKIRKAKAEKGVSKETKQRMSVAKKITALSRKTVGTIKAGNVRRNK